MRNIYFKRQECKLTHQLVCAWPPHCINTSSLHGLVSNSLSSTRNNSFSCERNSVIHLWLLLLVVVLYNINSSVLDELFCVCMYTCFRGKVSQSFSFLSLFSLLLQHLPASQLSDSSAPCFLAFWLTCSSLLPSTVSFMPCGSPHSLFLFHVSIFSWCIYLTSSTFHSLICIRLWYLNSLYAQFTNAGLDDSFPQWVILCFFFLF